MEKIIAKLKKTQRVQETVNSKETQIADFLRKKKVKNRKT